MRSGGVQKCGRKGAAGGGKIWKTSKDVWKPCNPLKSHKTAKDLFGKAWSKTAWIWKSLEKKLGGRLYSAASAPPGYPFFAGPVATAQSARPPHSAHEPS